MKIARIAWEETDTLAMIDDDHATPMAVDASSPYAVLLADAARTPRSAGDPIALADVQLLAPIDRPGSVIAVGLNYADHAAESGMDAPSAPVTFPKLPQSIIGPGDPIRWRATESTEVDYEAELACIIADDIRDVSAADALGHVLGYTCCNDVSARDAQFSDGQWLRSKSFDTFCPLGPWLVTPDEVGDPQDLVIRCTLNGQRLQDSTTAKMIFGVAEIIAYLSRSFTLRRGDVITTGTPAGVGFSRKPPIYLADGDTVEVEIERIGTLSNPCVQPISHAAT
ncbi:MAG: fumarylacetoacetate hydrolase family protein [Actinobacteria bacterium]|nr:fumarylacetoacetate hydrolase family protein [Actinomycetota bacterium]